ncbi:MAG: orotidine-5'-phosphate decarboxylase [Deltaproteobacteria bacterium]|nr:orotidine-5'-phosphate decarboxylase [Deltaproteobacteria bacterium]
MKKPQLIVALDFDSGMKARELCQKLRGVVSYYKVGPALYLQEGPDIIKFLRGLGVKIFLDLKLFDIPSTVLRTAFEIGRLEVDMFTVHAMGGGEMIRAAVEGALEGSRHAKTTPPAILGVTLLTSWNEKVLEEVGISLPVEERVLQLAQLTLNAGAEGVIAAGENVAVLRKELGDQCLIVVPGVRLRGSQKDDQQRIVTPKDLVRSGADYFVMGRPIIAAAEPLKAAREVIENLASD